MADLNLSPSARSKLDARRRRGAKKRARLLGRQFYREASDQARQELWVLVAIMRDAQGDVRAHRQIIRAMVDGVLDAVKENGRYHAKKK